MTTITEQLADERMGGGPFAAAFTVGAVVGTAIAAALIFLV